MDNGYLETMVMVWICRNPSTLEGQQALAGQSVLVGLSFSRMSIEDFAMLVWEPSPLVGRLVLGHMVVYDSSVWFSQTIPMLNCFPWVHDVHYHMYLPLDIDSWICWNPCTIGGVFRRLLVGQSARVGLFTDARELRILLCGLVSLVP
ncbi:hypothetical protein Pyn_34469 [Prunus yedoensis var. nudiflora]|uniref:Uncharacterized protein n=1 Tax=Prunus yedoensis var. nudiflora TaxID=2094558 RepID=A0A314UEC6_PRUYE|nr:hypothetical protein Pyn_34469 [Prunus yedoensis var. nudiflora]